MIHQYKSHGYNIVLDVNSGSIHVMEELPYTMIGLLSEGKPREEILELMKRQYKEEDIKECFEEIDYLIKENRLFTEDIYQPYIEDIIEKKKPVVKALCLHIAHDCNLACKYCFAEEGEYHGKRGFMSEEIGKKALDFLIANSGNRRNLEVDFFGGEPLLNWEVVKKIVEYGRSIEQKYHKNFRFTFTTNGVLLNDEIIEYCNKEMSNVVLSLDGRQEVNDKMRPFRGGQGSYDKIVPKFQKFVETRGDKDYFVRGTFTHFNKDFSKDVLHYADLGFKKLSMEPVVAEDGEEYAITWEDIGEICEEYDRLTQEMIERAGTDKEFTFFHFMIDLSGGPCVAKRLSGCGSGTEYLAVTPWGELYPCHQFVGHEEYQVGHVDTGITRQDLCEQFKHCHVYSKPECQKCFAKFYCSGGCAANSNNFKGNIHDVYDIGCVLERKRVECALALNIAIADKEMSKNE